MATLLPAVQQDHVYISQYLLNLLQEETQQSAIAELVCGGAKINEPALGGNTPLHFAIAKLSAHAVNTMIQRGADVKVISPDCGSSLLAAASCLRKSM